MDERLSQNRQKERRFTQPKLQYPVLKGAGMDSGLLAAIQDYQEQDDVDDGHQQDDVDCWLVNSVKPDPAYIDKNFNRAFKIEAERTLENLPELKTTKNVGGSLSLHAKVTQI